MQMDEADRGVTSFSSQAMDDDRPKISVRVGTRTSELSPD